MLTQARRKEYALHEQVSQFLQLFQSQFGDRNLRHFLAQSLASGLVLLPSLLDLTGQFLGRLTSADIDFADSSVLANRVIKIRAVLTSRIPAHNFAALVLQCFVSPLDLSNVYDLLPPAKFKGGFENPS